MYATRDYPQLGTADSLLVASSNLLARLGNNIDPLALTAYLAEFGGVYEPQEAPCRYDGSLAITGQGNSGTPSTEHAITLFTVDNRPFYCAVDRIEGNAMVIIDSADGQPKKLSDYEPTYGPPLAWWSFGTVELPIEEEPPAPPMVYVKNTINNINYHRLKTAPQKYYVNRPEGATKKTFEKVENHRDFTDTGEEHAYGSMVRIMGTAHHPVIPTGQDFFIDADDWGQFTRTGHVDRLQGFFMADLTDTPPPPFPAVKKICVPVPESLKKQKPKEETEEVIQVIKMPVDVSRFNFQWLNPEHEPVRYKAMQRLIIKDYSERAMHQQVAKGTTLAMWGTFTPYTRGKVYLLLKTDSEPFDYWYGVEELTEAGTRKVEEIPDYTDLQETTTTIPERLALNTPHFTDHLVNLVSLVDVAAIRGITNLKHSIRSKKWNQSKKR